MAKWLSSRSATYRGDAYPAFGWAACVARVDVDLDTAEVHVREVLAATRRYSPPCTLQCCLRPRSCPR